MRNFHAGEQRILKYIISVYSPNVDVLSKINLSRTWNLFESLAKQNDVQITFNTTEKVILVKSCAGKYDGMYDFQKRANILYGIIEYSSLLEYLEENHQIYFFNAPNTGIQTFEAKYRQDIFIINSEMGSLERTVDMSYHEYPILEGYGNEYLFEILGKAIIPSTELIEFVNNDFKDKEQLQHEENLVLQNRALDVSESLGKKSIDIANTSLRISKYSFLATLFSIVIALYAVYAPIRSDNTKPKQVTEGTKVVDAKASEIKKQKVVDSVISKPVPYSLPTKSNKRP